MLGFSVLGRGRRLTVRARAKVNLGLEILGRRPDGYHELVTLMSAIDLADRVTLETTDSEDIELACDGAGVPAGPDNLAWRAAELLRGEARTRQGLRIRIVKTIPVAAGLGGGSVDAAAVLVGASRLWGLSLPAGRAQVLATALGMDVPFFLGAGPALASGRGERLTAVARSRSLALVVVNPGFPLSTAEVYGRLGPGDFTSGDAVRALVDALPGDARTVAPRLCNGLERVVAEQWPGLIEVKSALVEAGALAALMSGSGPTVIGVAPSGAAARRIRSALAGRPWRTWVTRTVAEPALTVGAGRRVGVTARGVASWGVAKR